MPWARGEEDLRSAKLIMTHVGRRDEETHMVDSLQRDGRLSLSLKTRIFRGRRSAKRKIRGSLIARAIGMRHTR
jgi:hypothetical protein